MPLVATMHEMKTFIKCVCFCGDQKPFWREKKVWNSKGKDGE